MALTLPKVSKLIFESNGNEIWHCFGGEQILDDIQFISTSPFVINSNGINYLLISDKDDNNAAVYDYVLLTAKKPTQNGVNENQLRIKRWLKNLSFQTVAPEQVVASWKDQFKFIKENEDENVKGLRPPQLGALHSILAHIENSEDKAIIVMPTGTGKTETMLATLIANECKRLLVSVPSNSLRTQISDKFTTLGLLREFGIIGTESMNPIVGIVKSGFQNAQELQNFISKCNVVVSTMDILTDCSNDQRVVLKDLFSHFFVDEAHHSEAKTWKELIGKFDKEKVFLFTATPYRNDGKNLQGKVIFNFSLRKAQEQKYYKQINYLPIREYHKKLADKKIADKAVEQLKVDIATGYNHILMARCMVKVELKRFLNTINNILSIILSWYTLVSWDWEKKLKQ